MLISNLFLPILKEDPKEAAIASHRLMLRSGMIRQLTSGIYNWLPLGLKVMQKIEKIVREEMHAIGAQELLLPCIQPTDIWVKSGRFASGNDLSSEMLKIKDRHGVDLTFTPTAEEVIVELFAQSVQSYKQLPTSLYQISWKFRDEIRPRFGVMRAREFSMKDAYSFHASEECALNTYQDMLNAYLKSYKRMGLIAVPVAADSGAIGGNYSHEFHVLANTGESEVFIEQAFLDHIAENDSISLSTLEGFYANEEEKHKVAQNIPNRPIVQKRGIEVGHVFYLGDKYTKAMNCLIQDGTGQRFHPLMGCYGLGISRLVAAVIEAHHDAKGIVWPSSIAPFGLGIVNVKPGDTACDTLSNQLYKEMQQHEPLYDDSDESLGSKLTRMELIGVPLTVTIGPKSIKEHQVEITQRKNGSKTMVNIDALSSFLSSVL